MGKAFQLEESQRLRTPEIETANFVLLDCFHGSGFILPLRIMAANDPTLLAYSVQPLVIWRVVFEAF